MADEEKKGMRLGKFIAMAGIESRRGAERLIKAGKVTINRKVEKNPATHVDPDTDKVFVGRRRAILGETNSADAEVFVVALGESHHDTKVRHQWRDDIGTAIANPISQLRTFRRDTQQIQHGHKDWRQ